MANKKKKRNIFALLQKLGNIFYGLVFIVLLLVAAIVAFSTFKFPGNYRLFSVQSGSMEPTIKVGSIVLVKPQSNYRKGDIVTVTDPQNRRSPVTHRIFSIEEATAGATFQTKGDANKTPDAEKRLQKDILGKVYFSIPYLGYVSSYSKTRDGLIFLVIIPVTIIVYSEMVTIKNETVKLLKDRKKRKLSGKEKLEVEIGEEEIKVEKWWHKLWKTLFKKKND